MYVTLQSLFIAGVDRVKDGERGATATEYALLVAFIALAIVGGVTAFGTNLGSFFNGLGSKVGIL
ncbi:Flp family type IVb pilin [Arthrobacter sp. STN4]|uniref:Flp family type IVb pilin n=1 Tax=Arthrobacter sp. STN4 TaxID=2923276 RepID=UPI00211A46F7|nr:Flp family type IVb pilin [Arthrobacter sp. STN4]MCQ9163600.1 Flp family type IVb pilin [Arthrobacter sp. STN4]